MEPSHLVQALDRLHPPTPAACLVLLWTFYEPNLAKIENALRSAGIQPRRIEPVADTLDSAVLREHVGGLERLEGREIEFDCFALALIMSLDRALKDMSPKRIGGKLLGVDGKPYRLRLRNNFIADTYDQSLRGVTWAAQQGDTMYSYARHTVLVPEDSASVDGFTLQHRANCCDRGLTGRLRKARLPDEFRIMLWPITTEIDYPEMDGVGATPPPPFVSLRAPRNEDVLQADLETALGEAAKQRVTILIFPELAIPPNLANRVRAILNGHGSDGHPILTCLALCHADAPGDGNSDVNEAVLLGPEGRELHRHRKLEPFTIGTDFPCGERIETGSTIAVIETPVGNLQILICLDLFHVRTRTAVERSYANVLLVPSLSPKISAHQTAAAGFGASQLASTFVCNRWLRPTGEEATSFYLVPRRDARLVKHLPDHQKFPYLLFQL